MLEKITESAENLRTLIRVRKFFKSKYYMNNQLANFDRVFRLNMHYNWKMVELSTIILTTLIFKICMKPGMVLCIALMPVRFQNRAKIGKLNIVALLNPNPNANVVKPNPRFVAKIMVVPQHIQDFNV